MLSLNVSVWGMHIRSQHKWNVELGRNDVATSKVQVPCSTARESSALTLDKFLLVRPPNSAPSASNVNATRKRGRIEVAPTRRRLLPHVPASTGAPIQVHGQLIRDVNLKSEPGIHRVAAPPYLIRPVRRACTKASNFTQKTNATSP